jgi:hypothetical protein
MIPFPYQTGQFGRFARSQLANEYTPQDLTTFTEVDPNSSISVTSSRATVSNLSRNESAYLYKDFGSGYFSSDLSVNFDVVVSAGSNGGLWTMIGFSNTLGSNNLWADAIYANYFSTGNVLRAIEINSSSFFTDTYPISLGTTYYCRLVRDESIGANGTLYVYVATSSANRNSGTWIDTMSVALKDKEDFRYFYATASFNTTSPTALVSGYVENIEIKLSV